MKKTILIPTLLLIISLFAVGCVPMQETMRTALPIEPTRISSTIPTQPTKDRLEGERHYETDGGFSYVPPKGWEFFEVPGFKYLGLMDSSPTGEVSSNVVFVDERYTGSLKNYVEEALKVAKQVNPKFEVLSVDEVVTDSGIHGISVVEKNEFNGLQMMQVQFMFDLGEKKLVMTYTMNIDEEPDNILAIGDVIDSLQFDD
jgi:hypothetical protein